MSKITQHERLEARRTPGILGQAPDEDNVPPDFAKDYGHREDAFRHSEIDGFWKKSEDMKCRRGVPMIDIDMAAHFGGPTWQRAGQDPKVCAD